MDRRNFFSQYNKDYGCYIDIRQITRHFIGLQSAEFNTYLEMFIRSYYKKNHMGEQLPKWFRIAGGFYTVRILTHLDSLYYCDRSERSKRPRIQFRYVYLMFNTFVMVAPVRYKKNIIRYRSKYISDYTSELAAFINMSEEEKEEHGYFTEKDMENLAKQKKVHRVKKAYPYQKEHKPLIREVFTLSDT